MSSSAHLPDWRDAAAYHAIAICGPDGLAWELLRRDLTYQQFALQARGFGAATTWGLHFR